MCGSVGAEGEGVQFASVVVCTLCVFTQLVLQSEGRPGEHLVVCP